mmetsp:Transcript_6057/g.13780  ORF Transcript_6057/g.13780 Transcript_6057/m.13780 type:complete len:222 (-) Transcript_6057:79-744(-)
MQQHGVHQVWGDVELDSSNGSTYRLSREADIKDIQWNSMSESSETSSFNSKEEYVDIDDTRARIAEQKAKAIERAVTDGEQALEDSNEVADDRSAGQQDIELTEDGLPSVGSSKHAIGKCSPCHYYNTKGGCTNGVKCSFCHMHCKETRQRPCKAKRAKAKSQAGVLDQSFDNSDDREKVAEELRSKGGYLESVVKSKMRQKDRSDARGSSDEKPKQIVSL